MEKTQETPVPVADRQTLPASSRLLGWLCAGVIGASVLACVVLAAFRSNGLVSVTVTALEEDAEPRDHNLPLIKRNESLPDYELILVRTDGGKVRLGARPDSSAVKALTWQVSDPVSVSDIASVRLQERDQLLSDAVAEVPIQQRPVTSKNYRFEFVSERSAAVGVQSFFETPIGKSIAAGFCLAVLLMLYSLFAV